MNRKQQQPADDNSDKIAFETINLAIDRLMKQLAAKGVCSCCVAQGLMYRGAFLHAEVAGAEDTVALCLDVADAIEHPDAARVSDTQH